MPFAFSKLGIQTVLMRHHSITKLPFTIFCYLLSALNLCVSQDNLLFDHFTSENGLTENVVYVVFQDSKGFLWIGTHDGLNRYDGYEFKKFRHNPADNNSLPDNTIKSICEDGQGNLWLVTNAGVCRFNPLAGKFTGIALRSNTKNVKQILAVNENELIVRFDAEFSLINIHTLAEIAIGYNFLGQTIFAIGVTTPLSKDNKGNIYVANNSARKVNVWRYDNSRKSFNEFMSFQVDKSWANHRILFAFVDSYDQCWIGIQGAQPLIYKLSVKAKKNNYLKPKKGTNEITCIYEDKERNIWIATDAGLWCYDHQNNKLNNYRHDNSINSISWDFIQTICQDNTGIMWIGTSNGLNKLNPLQRKFRHLSIDKGADAGLFNNFVLGIYPETGEQVRIHYNFWKSYFSRFNLKNNYIRHYSIPGYSYADYIREVVVKTPEKLNDSILKKAIAGLRKVVTNVAKPDGNLFIDSRKNLWYVSGYWITDLKTLQKWNCIFTDSWQ